MGPFGAMDFQKTKQNEEAFARERCDKNGYVYISVSNAPGKNLP